MNDKNEHGNPKKTMIDSKALQRGTSLLRAVFRHVKPMPLLSSQPVPSSKHSTIPSRGGYIVSGFRKFPSERFQKFPSGRFHECKARLIRTFTAFKRRHANSSFTASFRARTTTPAPVSWLPPGCNYYSDTTVQYSAYRVLRLPSTNECDFLQSYELPAG